MIKTKWQIGGRTVRPDQIGEEIMKEAMSAVRSEIEMAVKGVRCPVHGGHASGVRAVPRVGSKMSFQYEACCEDLETAIAKRLEER